MAEKQKTIQKEVFLKGVGLHSGQKTTVSLKPAPVGSGIVFVRVDIDARPAIKADIAHVLTSSVLRCTSIGSDQIAINTVEHLMAAFCGLGITNAIVEIDGDEVPGMDGSSLEFIRAVKACGIVEQNEDALAFEVREPIWVEQGNSSIVVVPASDFKISYTLDYRHSFLGAQCFTVSVSPETFEKEVAPCRTFCLESEAAELRKMGLGKGANYENTLVIGAQGVKQNRVRFADEFARHKVLDFIGDSYLLGMPIKGHVFAQKSGHALNLQLLKKIEEQRKKFEPKKSDTPHPPPLAVAGGEGRLDIREIMSILPHRYPFLLVDRVLHLEPGKRATGIKNVTINDNFFQGHFPSRPIMPGVLMVEAMAQVGGIAVLTGEQHKGQLAFFSSVDNVKFRKIVSPGDQLVIEAEVIRDKTRTAQICAQAKVGDDVVSQADIMIAFVDGNYLNG